MKQANWISNSVAAVHLQHSTSSLRRHWLCVVHPPTCSRCRTSKSRRTGVQLPASAPVGHPKGFLFFFSPQFRFVFAEAVAIDCATHLAEGALPQHTYVRVQRDSQTNSPLGLGEFPVLTSSRFNSMAISEKASVVCGTPAD